MPYNNTPITPSKEVTGTVALPLARVKKIIAADDDIANCSNNAAFMITVAAEMFLQHLVEQSYNIVKSERKPRRNIQYRDVANAVARVENLEFLTDVVPKTTTFRQHKQKIRAQQGPTGEAQVEGVEEGTARPVEHTPADQLRIDEMPSRMIPPEAQLLRNPEPMPTSRVEVVVERQAINGASQHVGDAMDIDAEGRMPPGDNVFVQSGIGTKMEQP